MSKMSASEAQAGVTSTSNLVCFLASLNEIITKIEYSRPVFVKCIKPNENSFSTQFVSAVVAKQIRELGLVEYARVRKLNYPVKIEFAPFLKRFVRFFFEEQNKRSLMILNFLNYLDSKS